MREKSVEINEKSIQVQKIADKLLKAKTLEEIVGSKSPLNELIKEAIERILESERDEHLGYSAYKKVDDSSSNSRNGYSKKSLLTSKGEIEIKVPRDRDSSFEPKLIPKHKHIDSELESKILSLYSIGMSTRDIEEQIKELYGIEISPSFVSKVSSNLKETIDEWQERPLENLYVTIFLDGIYFKVREEGKVISKVAYTALGIDTRGESDILGIWIAENEGSAFWSNVLYNIKKRGVNDILIASVDGLKGFPEAIKTVFPNTVIQTCIVHQIRTSLRFTGSKYHKLLVKDMKLIYQADDRQMAERELEIFEEKWKKLSPAMVDSWKNNWHNLSSFLDYPPVIRKMMYTTNAVESVHRQFRKITKNKCSFPNDEALRKQLFLAIQNATKKIKRKYNWNEIISALKIYFGDRLILE